MVEGEEGIFAFSISSGLGTVKKIHPKQQRNVKLKVQQTKGMVSKVVAKLTVDGLMKKNKLIKTKTLDTTQQPEQQHKALPRDLKNFFSKSPISSENNLIDWIN